MRKSSMLGMKTKTIERDWFGIGVELERVLPIYVQDTPHVGTKLRNAFMKTSKIKNKFPFGEKFFIRQDHVKFIMNNFPKDQHELTPTVFDDRDRQNFSSVLRICDPKVTSLMKKYVHESDGTVTFLQILHDVIEAYRNPNISPLERIEKMWYSLFLLRIWRQYIVSNDELNLKDNFISMNCYSCIELNAHSLILLMLHLKDINMPHFFMTQLFESQPCENFFRQIRSFTSTYSTVVNCSVKEVLGRIKKLQLQNDISNRSDFEFPRAKIATNVKSSESFLELPTQVEIIAKVEICKRKATQFAIKMGLTCKSKAKLLDFECPVPQIQPKEMTQDKNKIVSISPILLKPINLKNFAEKFDGLQIPENSPYVQVVCEGSKEFVIKITSLCWLLRHESTKLSSDRVVRVKAPCSQNKK